MEILVRDAKDSDIPFVISSWLKHYKGHSYFAKRIKTSVYFKWHHMIVSNILARPNAKVLIAHPVGHDGEEDLILGFLVYEDAPETPIVHFCIVKEELRRMGIARKLFEKAGLNPDRLIFTHWTFDANDLVRKYPKMTYDPYRI